MTAAAQDYSNTVKLICQAHGRKGKIFMTNKDKKRYLEYRIIVKAEVIIDLQKRGKDEAAKIAKNKAEGYIQAYREMNIITIEEDIILGDYIDEVYYDIKDKEEYLLYESSNEEVREKVFKKHCVKF